MHRLAFSRFGPPAEVLELQSLELPPLAEGEVRLRLEVEAPPRRLQPAVNPLPGMTIIINGKVIGGPEQTLSAANFALTDARGRPFQAVKAVDTGKGSGPTQEVILTYRPRPGAGAAARLVYRDGRSTIVEVPFALRNVPLK